MRSKRIECTLILILTGLFLSSCSCYFTAGLNGNVTDEETGSGIQGVSVYAYLSKGARDAAADGYIYSHDNPFTDSNAYFRTVSAANGDFSIKSIKWNSNSPVYGKDGDNATVYLLFFHENYGLVKGEVAITSGSINESAKTTLTKIREEKNISFVVRHPNLARTDRYTENYKATLVEQENPGYEKDPDLYIKRTGNTTFSISYLKSTQETEYDIPNLVVTEFFSIENPVDASSRQVKKEDSSTPFLTDDEIENFSLDIQYTPNTSTYYLYAKPIKFNYPTISGRITSGDNPAEKVYGTEADNGCLIKLTDSSNKVLATATTKRDINTGSASLVITNGFFELTPNQYFVDDDYTEDDPNSVTLTLTYPDSSSSDRTKDIVINYPMSGSIDTGAIDRT